MAFADPDFFLESLDDERAARGAAGFGHVRPVGGRLER
jgi:hypothetical protein